jgi:hypothetical protein
MAVYHGSCRNRHRIARREVRVKNRAKNGTLKKAVTPCRRKGGFEAKAAKVAGNSVKEELD